MNTKKKPLYHKTFYARRADIAAIVIEHSDTEKGGDSIKYKCFSNG